MVNQNVNGFSVFKLNWHSVGRVEEILEFQSLIF